MHKQTVSARFEDFNRVDCRRQYCPVDHWILSSLHEVKIDIDQEYLTTQQQIIQDIPFIVPFNTRVRAFRQWVQSEIADGTVRVVVKRDSVFDDGFSTLFPLKSRLRRRVAVTFVDSQGLQEAGIDGTCFLIKAEASLKSF